MSLTNRQMLHREYLKSPLWREVRNRALEQYGSICSKCGGYGTDVHHKTYRGAGGNERMEDLQVLCRGCHEAFHSIERGIKRRRGKKSANVKALFGYLTEVQKGNIRDAFGSEPYALIVSESEEGDKAREMAMGFLGIYHVYGIPKEGMKKRSLRRGGKKRIHY